MRDYRASILYDCGRKCPPQSTPTTELWTHGDWRTSAVRPLYGQMDNFRMRRNKVPMADWTAAQGYIYT